MALRRSPRPLRAPLALLLAAAAAATALLLLQASPAAASRAASSFSAATNAMPRRALLWDGSRICCSDCEDQFFNDEVAILHCFGDCVQDPCTHTPPHIPDRCPDWGCVDAGDCLDLSRDNAGTVADVACAYASVQCQPTMVIDGVAQAVAQGGQVTRRQCYKAAKNVCIMYCRDYAQSGYGNCYGYVHGYGNCGASEFKQYFDTKMGGLCDSIAKGIAIDLP